MRSQGQVRFIRISSRFQIAAAGALAVVALVWVATVAAALIAQILAHSDRSSLLEREAAVQSAESRVADYRQNLDSVASDLQKRQELIEKVVESNFGDLPEQDPENQDPANGQQKGTVSDSSSETGKAVRKISQLLPHAEGLARIEARQIAFVERLTHLADSRARRAETAIRRVGLNPALISAASARHEAQGGPLIPLLDGGGDKIDPRFERLALSVARMDALERGLATLPSTSPASLEYVSSGFGVRSDPFTGGAAFHAGLDFRGPVGAPIYAAAGGTVAFAGARAGYGNVVEIRHGNGLTTRYAHLSRIDARPGVRVAAGAVIGRLGNTGRSTGPHLHFEVRINDRPVNPRPFLQGIPHVFQEARAGRPGNAG